MALSPSKNIYLTSLEDVSISELQMCYLPSELITMLGTTIGDYIYIKVDKGRGVICKVFPTLSSYCHVGYQVLAYCHVFHNVSLVRDISFKKEIGIQTKDMSVLKNVSIEKIYINTIMDSAENVIIAKKCINEFTVDVQYLLQLYKFINNCMINCSSNPLAKLLGISYIVINEVELMHSDFGTSDNWVGQVTPSTSIHISSIESTERHLYLIDKPALLGGLNHILSDLRSLVKDPWRFRREFATAGVTYPSGVLLIGPPGCGKSSLARQLCHETQACLIATAGAEFQSPYEGETLRNFKNVAKKAALLSKEGPCIFFIDEIDSICPARSQELSVQDLQLTAQVLLTLDECKKYPHLLVMAATNRPYALDPAVRRSGRLDVEILLNAPMLEERREILRIHSEGLLPGDHPALMEVATATPGFVGADLRLVCDKTREVFPDVFSGNTNSNATPSDIYGEMLRICGSITPSIHKTLEFITTKPSPSAVGGLDHIREKLNHLLTKHTKYSQFYKDFCLKRPKGILLYGPRGCGKTRLVSLLASQKEFAFLSANASHLLSPFVGDSEKRIAALFHSARIAQPSIIFIDEIDGIFGSRNAFGGGVRVNLLTELLQAMDGADVAVMSLQGSTKIGNKIQQLNVFKLDNIIVCAATNNPQKLDSALLRPGRFDHIIYVPPPDIQARIDILKLKSSKLQVDEDCLLKVAAASDGWTGAELENLITQAAIRSVLEGHFVEATMMINIPDEVLMAEFRKFSPTLTASELKFFEEFEQKFVSHFLQTS